ncbi:MAG: hypothetical protein Q7S21_05225 [archaeon]|nr:hypothetical protein [archaeon]
MTHGRFLKIYANLPLNAREEVVLVIKNNEGKDTPISWNVAYFEIKNNTKLGEQILKKLIELKII